MREYHLRGDSLFMNVVFLKDKIKDDEKCATISKIVRCNENEVTLKKRIVFMTN